MLIACSSQQGTLEDYLNRLENVLDVNSERTQTALLNFPTARDLILKPSSSNISIREFLSLRKCKLHTIIAHRNSLIGKVSKPSQLLFNDLDILADGPDCLTQIEDKALAKKLQLYLSEKQQNIGTVLWKAILGESENRSFWIADHGIKNYPYQLKQETLPSIKALSSFVDSVMLGHYTFSDENYQQIERHLGQLRFGDGGMLLFHYARLKDGLQLGNTLIEKRLARPLCLQNKPTDAARYFQNVVNEVFVKKLQKKAVLLNQREAQLIPDYLQLESQLLEHAPSAYQQWANARGQLINNGKAATKQHAQTIQKLYQQCGLTVGNQMR